MCKVGTCWWTSWDSAAHSHFGIFLIFQPTQEPCFHPNIEQNVTEFPGNQQKKKVAVIRSWFMKINSPVRSAFTPNKSTWIRIRITIRIGFIYVHIQGHCRRTFKNLVLHCSWPGDRLKKRSSVQVETELNALNACCLEVRNNSNSAICITLSLNQLQKLE